MYIKQIHEEIENLNSSTESNESVNCKRLLA